MVKAINTGLSSGWYEVNYGFSSCPERYCLKREENLIATLLIKPKDKTKWEVHKSWSTFVPGEGQGKIFTNGGNPELTHVFSEMRTAETCKGFLVVLATETFKDNEIWKKESAKTKARGLAGCYRI